MWTYSKNTGQVLTFPGLKWVGVYVSLQPGDPRSTLAVVFFIKMTQHVFIIYNAFLNVLEGKKNQMISIKKSAL